MFSKLIPVLFLSLALLSSVVLGLPNPRVHDSVRLSALLIGVLLSNPHLIRFPLPVYSESV
jgi:hypothetical protein